MQRRGAGRLSRSQTNWDATSARPARGRGRRHHLLRRHRRRAGLRAPPRSHIAGVAASGNRLTIRLTRPSPNLVERRSMGIFCAVTDDAPARSSGIDDLPMAGPYYIRSVNRGRQIVLARNPNYHGPRKAPWARSTSGSLRAPRGPSVASQPARMTTTPRTSSTATRSRLTRAPISVGATERNAVSIDRATS
jgi:hypothetical protein